MKGLLHKIPPVPVYCVLRHVETVIYFLRTLFPLNTLCLKMLTFKAVTLVALAVAPRVQTIVAMNIDNVKTFNKLIFGFDNLLRTSCQEGLFRPEFFYFSFYRPSRPNFWEIAKKKIKEIFFNFIFLFPSDSCQYSTEFSYVFSFCLFYCCQVD